MNSEDDKEEHCSESKDKIDPDAGLESRVVLPSEIVQDGSGDHLPLHNTKAATFDDIPDNVTKNQTEKSEEHHKIGDGDTTKENNEAKLQDSLDSANISDQAITSEADNFEEALVVPTKPTFLEGVSSLVEDMDSENQEEDLVLKWDDDDEDGTILPLKDDQIDEQLNQDTEITKVTAKESAEVYDVADKVSRNDTIEETEPKISEDDADVDQEDLLSEIDAQIAELGASLSKAEKENLIGIEKSHHSNMLTNIDTDSDNLEKSMSDLEEVIAIDNVKEVTTDKDTKDEKLINSEKSDQEKIPTNDDTVSDNLDKSMSALKKVIVMDNVEEIEEFSATDGQDEKVMNAEKSIPTKMPTKEDSASDNIGKSMSALEEVILDKVEEKKAITAKDSQDENAQKLDSKDIISEMEMEDALLADNDNIQIKINADSSSKTETAITESIKGSEIAMETDIPVEFEDRNLSVDQNQEDNLPNSSEIIANSTKLNNSLVGDAELETSCKDDTFVHDSSSSIDEKTHGVNKPNVMLEIPTQEIIDLDESVLSSQDKEMSVDGNEINDANVSVDLSDDKKINEGNKKSDVDKESSPSNVSIDLTDEKDSTNECMGKSDVGNELNDKNIINDEVITKKDAILEKETIPTDVNKSKPDASEDIEKQNVDDSQMTKDSSLSKDDATGLDVDTKMIEESKLVYEQIKSTEEVENDKVENAKIVEKESENNLPKSDTIITRDDTTSIENQTDLPEAVPKAEDCLTKDILTEIVKDSVDVLPSTSQAALQSALDPSDDAAEVTEATDSLGLLAECSRVREEDDGDIDGDGDGDGDDQETSDRDDYDEDYDPDDESSNQQTAEHSEDSAQHSETDMPKQDNDNNTIDTDKPFRIIDSITTETHDKDISEDATDKDLSEPVNKETEEKEFGFEISNVVSGEDKEGDGEVEIDDEIVCEEVEVSENTVDTDQPAEEIDISALKEIADEPTTEDTTKKEVPFKVHTESKLRELLQREKPAEERSKPAKKKLEIVQPSHVVSIVDLESSSEDESVAKPSSAPEQSGLTSINISKEIEVMSSGDNTSEIVSKEGETVITVPKSTAVQKIKSRLNTSEITIKTASHTESSTLVIPETKMGGAKAGVAASSSLSKFGELEVFNLDSDEEDSPATPPVRESVEPETEKPPSKCINSACSSDHSVPFYPADPSTVAFYDSQKKRRAMVCQICLYEKVQRGQKLAEGIKNFTPLLDLEEARSTQELVEISDSDSDDEAASDSGTADRIGLDNIPTLERKLSEMINTVWERFRLDARLKDAQDELGLDLERLEKESAEVNQMLDDCQLATDNLRSELYATFDAERHHLPGLVIYDTPDRYYLCPEAQLIAQQQQSEVTSKRRLSSASESQAKKPAIAPANTDSDKHDASVRTEELKSEADVKVADTSKIDDDKDISVVQLSAEAAPADLPPPGDIVRAPLQVGQTMFAMRHAFGSWIKAKILEVTPKGNSSTQNFTMCRVKFENKTSRNAFKLLPARCLAYFEPSSVRMTIGTRVIALFRDTSADKSGKRESFYSGVVAEVPNPVNKYRYLVFFDDGYAQYVVHSDTRLVCEFSTLVWEEVHPFSREFVREYLLAYPERPMVRLHTGQSLKTEWNGKWWLSRVVQVDASLAQVYFEQDKRTEWIYRGSTRLAPLYLELQAAEKHRARPLPRNRVQNKLNMPYVEYTRLDEQLDASRSQEAQIKAQQEELRRQRAVAKKSTLPPNVPPTQPAGNLDAVTSRVVYYTPKNAVRPYKMTSHACGAKCTRTDVLALKELRTYNPLAKPLLSGWERQIVRYKGHKEVMYRAPCGRRLRNMAELHRYLRLINSDMGVDLFDFGPNTHCLAEFVLNKCIVGKKDLSHGKENVPVPCVNYYDESLPEFCSYNTERTPTAGVPLCLDPEFLCGCDCTDDCQDKSKCACWKMTLEGARTIGLQGKVGYVYKRLPDPLPSGIYECNSRCKCKSTCLNRVAQHPLQLKLQVFKTLNRGWGIRALNDVPKGSFLCIYAGNLLTDATANLDGLNEGDEYLAELDYIEVVEAMKEGYEDDIPEQDKKLDRKELGKESESEETESEEEATNSKSDADDGDFEPGYIPGGISGFSKRLRKREKMKQKEADRREREQDAGKEASEDDCITISDDEELREPSSFAAQAGMSEKFISRYKSVRTLFGKDEACYIMDAKVQGNIGRYLNHSCSPNVFVQNVFVDTHDPRFPWVAFFALTHIRAGTELTWNYNYDVGSVPGKALYCYCGAPNCRGRLL